VSISNNFALNLIEIDVLRTIQQKCYNQAVAMGWHEGDKVDAKAAAVKIALCHSELSEALEGFRKDLMDDHLPHRKMAEVELADLLIRVFDLAGRHGLDVAAALAEKHAYNATRPDHKKENRLAVGGKKF